MTVRSSHRFSFLSGAAQDRVWNALTCPEASARYLHGMSLESEWAAGSPVHLRAPAGHVARGEVILAVPPRSLSFALEQGIAPCRIITWDLRAHPDGTVVRLTIDDVDGDCDEEVEDAWLPVVAALQGILAPPGDGPRPTG